MLQYYLRAEGLALSWVGTGRFIFSLNYTDADFDAVANKVVAAARAMERDGFWWSNEALTNKAIKRRILREALRQMWRNLSGGSAERKKRREKQRNGGEAAMMG